MATLQETSPHPWHISPVHYNATLGEDFVKHWNDHHLDHFHSQGMMPPWHSANLAAARLQQGNYAARGLAPPAFGAMKSKPEDRKPDASIFNVVSNNTTIRVKVSFPPGYSQHKGGNEYAAIINFHGGGWVFGGIDGDQPFINEVVSTNVVVFDVEYRTEAYPTPINDGKAAIEWIFQNHSDWKIDNKRIGVCGFSAGAHIAIYLALDLQATRKHPSLACLLLVVPVVNLEQILQETVPNHAPKTQALVGGLPKLQFFTKAFLQTESLINALSTVGSQNGDYSPTFRSFTAGFPPTQITVAQQDFLHGQGVAFATKLSKVAHVELLDFPNVMHVFPNQWGASGAAGLRAQEFCERACNFVERIMKKHETFRPGLIETPLNQLDINATNPHAHIHPVTKVK